MATFFDSIDYQAARHHLDYRGTFLGTLTHLEGVFMSTDDPNQLARIAFHSTRLLKAAIDYKIQTNCDGVPLITALQEPLLALHRMDRPGFAKAKEKLMVVLEEYPDLPNLGIYREIPLITWDKAYNQQNSNGPFGRLANFTGNQPVLFLPIGSAGYGAGLDLFARFSPDGLSAMYPFRYSVYRSGDHQPRLSCQEIDFLAKLAEGRLPVIFDIFACGGSTMTMASFFFEDNLFKPFFMYNKLKAEDFLSVEELNWVKAAPDEFNLSIAYRITTDPIRDRIIV